MYVPGVLIEVILMMYEYSYHFDGLKKSLAPVSKRSVAVPRAV